MKKKRTYQRPMARVVMLQHCTHLLTGSDPETSEAEVNLDVIFEEEDW